MKIFLMLLITSQLFAQEIDIANALRDVESGNIHKAMIYLQEVKGTNPNDPAVIFLDGVLTPGAEEAIKKYSTVYEKFPKSNYADASLYRICSYYYALGYYKKADDYKTKLKTEYPQSPYTKNIDKELLKDETIVESGNGDKNTEPGNYKFTIQAGAFLNADNAEKLREQLSKDGYESEIKTKEIGGSIFNIVLVGKYETESETETAKEILNKKYSLNVRTVRNDLSTP